MVAPSASSTSKNTEQNRTEQQISSSSNLGKNTEQNRTEQQRSSSSNLGNVLLLRALLCTLHVPPPRTATLVARFIPQLRSSAYTGSLNLGDLGLLLLLLVEQRWNSRNTVPVTDARCHPHVGRRVHNTSTSTISYKHSILFPRTQVCGERALAPARKR